jgi:hypothetical protein
LYGLTNNHVSGSCSHADQGLPIIAPGIYDVVAGGLDPFTIGRHHAALPLVPGSPGNVPAQDNNDAAIFRIIDASKVTSFQGNAYDTPATTQMPAPGMQVEKVGRTTGTTRGWVVGQVFGFLSIPYNASLYGFSGAVHFNCLYSIAGHGDLFSDSGDSGSLITSVEADGTRRSVGLVVGGMTDSKAPGGKLTLMLPIEPILASFNVSLVSGLNP